MLPGLVSPKPAAHPVLGRESARGLASPDVLGGRAKKLPSRTLSPIEQQGYRVQPVPTPQEMPRTVGTASKPLYEMARQARQMGTSASAGGSPAPGSQTKKPVAIGSAPTEASSAVLRPVHTQQSGGPPTPSEAGGSASERVRASILETMKRGINQARNRTDLAPGEKAMLEHMKMYVMETKLAEGNLSSDELQIWNDIKAEYESTSRSAALRSGGDTSLRKDAQ